MQKFQGQTKLPLSSARLALSLSLCVSLCSQINPLRSLLSAVGAKGPPPTTPCDSTAGAPPVDDVIARHNQWSPVEGSRLSAPTSAPLLLLPAQV